MSEELRRAGAMLRPYFDIASGLVERVVRFGRMVARVAHIYDLDIDEAKDLIFSVHRRLCCLDSLAQPEDAADLLFDQFADGFCAWPLSEDLRIRAR